MDLWHPWAERKPATQLPVVSLRGRPSVCSSRMWALWQILFFQKWQAAFLPSLELRRVTELSLPCLLSVRTRKSCGTSLSAGMSMHDRFDATVVWMLQSHCVLTNIWKYTLNTHYNNQIVHTCHPKCFNCAGPHFLTSNGNRDTFYLNNATTHTHRVRKFDCTYC